MSFFASGFTPSYLGSRQNTTKAAAVLINTYHIHLKTIALTTVRLLLAFMLLLLLLLTHRGT
jgi:hypothetical protein